MTHYDSLCAINVHEPLFHKLLAHFRWNSPGIIARPVYETELFRSRNINYIFKRIYAYYTVYSLARSPWMWMHTSRILRLNLRYAKQTYSDLSDIHTYTYLDYSLKFPTGRAEYRLREKLNRNTVVPCIVSLYDGRATCDDHSECTKERPNLPECLRLRGRVKIYDV